MHPTCDLPLNRSLPLVCICSLCSFLCGVGIGANDLSANFAMVVGSGSLNMRQAIIYCTVFELLGAAFMGGRVSDTIRRGIVDPALFAIDRDMVLIGMTCASFSAAIWLYLSTVFGLPVSITHTVVGSILGFALFSSGSFEYVQARGVVKIVLSWLLAPIAAGAVTAGIFYLMRKRILKVKGKSFEYALRSLPYCLGFSLLIDLMFIVIEKPPILSVTIARALPLWAQYLILLALIVLASCTASSVVFPRLAEEAWEQTSFVWEADVLRTEAEEVLPSTAAAAAAGADITDSAVSVEEPSRPSFFVGSVDTSSSDSDSERPQDVRMQQNISALLQETSSFLLSSVEAPELKLLPQQSVRPAPKTRRSTLPGPHREAEEMHALAMVPALPTYGTPSTDAEGGEESTSAMSPLSVNADDEFAERDWGLNHPMQPIRFGGMLIKPFNPRAEYLYTSLQVVAGSMSSFVHGAVAGANATAAFVILYETFTVSELNERSFDSAWAVLPAMLGIAIGMFSLGSRLMKTVGVELVTVTPARGWCMQVGGTLVTMVLTGIGIPVSLSQSQVGAAIGCGVLDARAKGVAWGIVAKIIGGWVVTLAISAVTTGASMWLLAFFYCM